MSALKKFATGFAFFLLAPCINAHAQPPSFAEVAPVFEQHCTICHRGDQAPLQLRLDTLDHLLEGSRNGPVINLKTPEKSELIRRLKGESLPRMPLTGPPFLSEDKISLILAWIKAGAPGNGPSGQPEKTVDNQTVSTENSRDPFQTVFGVFLSRCAKCHAEQGIMGPPPEDFRTTSYKEITTSGERVLLVPGVPQASEIVRRIKGQSLPQMPFDGPPYLPAEDITLIESWVAAGAPDSSGQKAPLPTGGRLRLEGRLNAFWELDGLPLLVNENTRIKKNPQPGDRVEVRATLSDTGEIRATRIRPR